MNGRTNSHGSTIDDLQVPLDPCTSLRAEARNGSVTLYWDDPVDKYATPEGETAQNPQQLVSVWDHTIVVRKVGNQPANPNDGIIVTSSGVRDQYLGTGYTDSSLTNDTTYYYGVFAVNEDGVASDGAFISATPVAGTPLSELTEGTLIKILENGAPVEFCLAKHNYEPELNGQGRELVVRKDVYDSVNWSSYSGISQMNRYSFSNLDDLLNDTYKTALSSFVQTAMATTSFYCYQGGGNSSLQTLTRSAFSLSCAELNAGTLNENAEGTALPTASFLKIAYLDGSPVRSWTRTTQLTNNNRAYYITTQGDAEPTRCDYSYYSRLCFTLPNDLLVDQNLNLIGS